jgi:hypothetical protein
LEVVLKDGTSRRFDFGQTLSIDGDGDLDTSLSGVRVGQLMDGEEGSY